MTGTCNLCTNYLEGICTVLRFRKLKTKGKISTIIRESLKKRKQCETRFCPENLETSGSIYVSEILLTYPSTNRTFCPNQEVSVNIRFGEGWVGSFPRNRHKYRLFSNHAAVKREQIIFTLDIMKLRQESGIGISFIDSNGQNTRKLSQQISEDTNHLKA